MRSRIVVQAQIDTPIASSPGPRPDEGEPLRHHFRRHKAHGWAFGPCVVWSVLLRSMCSRLPRFLRTVRLSPRVPFTKLDRLDLPSGLSRREYNWMATTGEWTSAGAVDLVLAERWLEPATSYQSCFRRGKPGAGHQVIGLTCSRSVMVSAGTSPTVRLALWPVSCGRMSAWLPSPGRRRRRPGPP